MRKIKSLFFSWNRNHNASASATFPNATAKVTRDVPPILAKKRKVGIWLAAWRAVIETSKHIADYPFNNRKKIPSIARPNSVRGMTLQINEPRENIKEYKG